MRSLPHRWLIIYCDPSWESYSDTCSGNEGVACLPMGSAAFARLTEYLGPTRCEGYEEPCPAGKPRRRSPPAPSLAHSPLPISVYGKIV